MRLNTGEKSCPECLEVEAAELQHTGEEEFEKKRRVEVLADSPSLLLLLWLKLKLEQRNAASLVDVDSVCCKDVACSIPPPHQRLQRRHRHRPPRRHYLSRVKNNSQLFPLSFSLPSSFFLSFFFLRLSDFFFFHSLRAALSL